MWRLQAWLAAGSCQQQVVSTRRLLLASPLVGPGINRWLTMDAMERGGQRSAGRGGSGARRRRGSSTSRAKGAKRGESTDETDQSKNNSFLADHAGADVAQRVRVFWDIENDLLNSPKFTLSAKTLSRERRMLKKKKAALCVYAGAAELLEIQTFCGGVGSMKRTRPGELALRCIRCRELCPESVSVPGRDADTAMIKAMVELAVDETALPGVVVCVSGDGGFAGALQQLREASHFIVVVSSSPSKLLRGVADLVHPQKLTVSGCIKTD